MFFWNSHAFPMIQQMLAIWYLVPLPFLKPAWTSGSSWLMYTWSLAWRIVIITLLACEIAMATHSSTLVWKFPWMEEPGRLQSMGSLGVRHDWVTSFSCIEEGNGNLLQCSCLENPTDRGAWWAAAYMVAQSRTWLKWLSSSSSMWDDCNCVVVWAFFGIAFLWDWNEN